ncbi:hypothetical protein CSOJ01_01126 [Colletotrichum sojae]|uniref:Uncharacterized protein n=1 Tax=Colletotrichum sojae TaxID=2175907 RepID=A0A8H6JUS2_9PEZI|nr:hypothetical protein CSOJ01_01126 [Colletotrichum sojae]
MGAHAARTCCALATAESLRKVHLTYAIDSSCSCHICATIIIIITSTTSSITMQSEKLEAGRNGDDKVSKAAHTPVAVRRKSHASA